MREREREREREGERDRKRSQMCCFVKKWKNGLRIKTIFLNIDFENKKIIFSI